MDFFDSLVTKEEKRIDEKSSKQDLQKKHLDLKPEFSHKVEVATSSTKKKRNYLERLEPYENEKYFLRSSKNREKKRITKKDESNAKPYSCNHCKYSSSTHSGYRQL